ncbi:MAG: sulfotransferase [Planctomycetes bacterium]|nr:sulfotransferase [Planctomycetota bacterium]
MPTDGPRGASHKPPIFILGCQRSGTSLLRRILDSHSGIACPPESAFLVQLARVYEVKRALQGLLDMGFAEVQVLERMGAFAASFFEDYARSKGKPRWADKTPHYVSCAETIDLMLQGRVQYLGIVRHGLDVARSLCDFDWGVLQPYLEGGVEKPLAALRFWRDQNAKLLDFEGRARERFLMLRYEDLTERPEEVLRAAFDFLDEPWEPAVLDFNAAPHDRGFEDPKITRHDRIVASSGAHREWPRELQERLRAEGKDMLERFGYA